MENFREPDAPMIGMFTRGQFFSFFLMALGFAFIVAAQKTAGLSAQAVGNRSLREARRYTSRAMYLTLCLLAKSSAFSCGMKFVSCLA